MFNATKDVIAGKSAQAYINARIARYGRVERLRLDSAKKQIEVVCQLDGESSSIAVTVEQYSLSGDGAKRYIEVVRCTCSRPWLQNALNDFVPGRRFELPGWAAAVL